ncbi:MAG: hypothetical protein KBC78_04175 [Candidatus Pacebacteria bacterium]|nr:hypothetical protein [Candidatus Paceibacterota bacterium]
MANPEAANNNEDNAGVSFKGPDGIEHRYKNLAEMIEELSAQQGEQK